MTEQSTVETEQTEKDSESTKYDQVQEDEAGEQTEKDSQEAEAMVEIDGEKVPVSELKSGYMRQKDYTKKTQELADLKREIARLKEGKTQKEEFPDEVKKAAELLKQYGFATKEDLLMQKAQDEDQKQFRKLLKANPELVPFKELLIKAGQNDNRPWDVIIKESGLLKSDKLAKVKRPLVGKSTPITESKAVKDMSMTEYAEWRKKNLGRQD